MSAWWAARIRTLATLVVLAVVVLVSVAWGWGKLTAPLPEEAEDTGAVCVDTEMQPGDELRAGTITVSVLNGSGRAGLASRTLNDLVGQGFGEGTSANVPEGVDVAVTEVWAAEKTPAVRLLRGYLQGKSRFRQVDDPAYPGLTVVVAERFKGVREGRESLPVKKAFTVCAPAQLAP